MKIQRLKSRLFLYLTGVAALVAGVFSVTVAADERPECDAMIRAVQAQGSVLTSPNQLPDFLVALSMQPERISLLAAAAQDESQRTALTATRLRVSAAISRLTQEVLAGNRPDDSERALFEVLLRASDAVGHVAVGNYLQDNDKSRFDRYWNVRTSLFVMARRLDAESWKKLSGGSQGVLASFAKARLVRDHECCVHRGDSRLEKEFFAANPSI